MLELVRRHPRYGYRRIWAVLRRGGLAGQPQAGAPAVAAAGAESAAENSGKSGGWGERERLRAAAGGAQGPRLGLGLHARPDGRRPAAEVVHAGGRVHAGVPGAGGAAADDGDGGDRGAGGVAAGAGRAGAHPLDNGPEFIAKAIRAWMAAAGLETLYIEPGAPWENGYAESFNSRCGTSC